MGPIQICAPTKFAAPRSLWAGLRVSEQASQADCAGDATSLRSMLCGHPPFARLSAHGKVAKPDGRDMPDFNVGFVIFPDITQPDFTGPLNMSARLVGAT
jgi:hypothetical protein